MFRLLRVIIIMPLAVAACGKVASVTTGDANPGAGPDGSGPGSNPTGPGLPSSQTSTFTAAPMTIPADGSSITSLTLTLNDSNGDAVANAAVTFSTTGTGNTFTPASGQTDASGKLTATLSSSTPGPRVITATSGAFTITTNMKFSAIACAGFVDFTTSTYNVNGNPQGIAAADVTGDGIADLIITDAKLGVLKSKGDGTFDPTEVETTTVSGPSGIAIGDFNADGKIDVAITEPGVNKFEVLTGNGDATFTSNATYATQSTPVGIAAGDFNADGILDLVESNQGSASAGVYIGQGTAKGNGAFATTGVVHSTGAVASSVAVADFDHDTRFDIVVANSQGGTSGQVDYAGKQLGSLTVLLDKSTIQTTQIADTVGGQLTNVTTLDFNEDGFADIAVANYDDSAGVDRVYLLANNKAGAFTVSGFVTIANVCGFVNVISADVNLDGHADLIVADADQGEVTVLYGNGASAFPTAKTYGVGAVPSALAVGDFDGDGRPDLAVGNSSVGTVSVLVASGCN